MDDVASLALALRKVRTSQEFKGWVRFCFRRYLPHAAFLGTAGRLYGVGSIPTNRVDIDFPLTMLEELKNCAGALNDPMISGWLRSGRPRFVDLRSLKPQMRSYEAWYRVLSNYGFENMTILGLLDHKARRFAAFQLGNVYGGGSLEAMNTLALLVEDMATTLWRVFDGQTVGDARYLVGHPTLALTPAELHIVELLAQGLSNKEIARLRGVSDSTVKTQVQKTGAKLGATRRAEIVAIAMPMLSPLPPQSIVDYGDDKL